jgi:AraC-like DNA-binding protein
MLKALFVMPHDTNMLDLFDPIAGEAIGRDRLADAELESAGSYAGVTNSIDRALGVIEEDAGRHVAIYVARLLAFCLSRLAGQSQYCMLPAAQARPKPVTFDSLDRWIAEHLKDDLRVEALAERVHMSPRNFARAYAKKRGRTPAKAVAAIRVAAARRLLEETEQRIDFIAEDSGFSCEEQMRCAFIRLVGIPPREYRRRFLRRLDAPSAAGVLDERDQSAQSGGLVSAAWIVEAESCRGRDESIQDAAQLPGTDALVDPPIGEVGQADTVQRCLQS